MTIFTCPAFQVAPPTCPLHVWGSSQEHHRVIILKAMLHTFRKTILDYCLAVGISQLSNCEINWVTLRSRDSMIMLKVKDWSLYTGVCPKCCQQISGFCEWCTWCSPESKVNRTTIHLEGFYAHIQTDETWKGKISRYGDPAFNKNGSYLLQLCCSSKLWIMSTFFQHRNVQSAHGTDLVWCTTL